MKSFRPQRMLATGLSAAWLFAAAGAAVAQPTTDWTYQGQLRDGGALANGNYDFRISLIDGGAATVAGPSIHGNVPVSNGLFTIPDVDFLSDQDIAHTQTSLLVEVRRAGVGSFVALPRQPFTGAPLANQIRRVQVAEGIDDSGQMITRRGTLITSAWGTSFSDGAGFFQAYDGELGATTARLDGDSDQNDSNGVATGRLTMGSLGTGGGGGEIVVQNNSGLPTFELLGGGDSASGTINLFNGNFNNIFKFEEGYLSPAGGGIFELFDEDGVNAFYAAADSTAPGAGFLIVRGSANTGLVVDGDDGTGANTTMSLFGTNSSVFRTGSSGDASVSLPTSAISSSEILNEAGAASNTNTSLAATISTTTDTTILSRTLTAPTGGYVLVIATAQIQFSHVNGTDSIYNFGVSDTATLPSNQDVGFNLASGAATQFVARPVTVHGLFSVSAGSHTFNFIGEKISSTAPDASVWDVQLSCIFVPTAYGTVTSTLLGPDMPDSASHTGAFMAPPALAELELERITSIEAEMARRDAEMQAMREEFDRLKAELVAAQNGQGVVDGVVPTRAPVANETASDINGN